MSTLITGAGMVGSLVAAQLLEGGEEPVLFDIAFSTANLEERLGTNAVPMVRGDVTELSELLEAVERYKVDRIIHTAGLLSSAMNDRPMRGVHVNLMGTTAVLETARLHRWSGSSSAARGAPCWARRLSGCARDRGRRPALRRPASTESL